MFARACWVTEEGSRPTILFLVKHIWNISDLNDTSPKLTKLASYICFLLYHQMQLHFVCLDICILWYALDYYVQLTNINVNITRGILFYFIWLWRTSNPGPAPPGPSSKTWPPTGWQSCSLTLLYVLLKINFSLSMLFILVFRPWIKYFR